MGYSNADITANQQLGYDDDCPLLIGKNLLNSSVISNETFTRASPNPSTTSRHQEYSPVSRVYDGHLDLPCAMEPYYAYPTSGGDSTYAWLSFGFSSPIAFDTVLITAHNAVTDRFNTVEVMVSDAAAFTSPAVVAKKTVSPLDTHNLRMIFPDLKDPADTDTDPQAYTGVDYLSVRWTNNNVWLPPRLGELVIGKRRQLRHMPQLSWNDKDSNANISTLETSTGNTLSYTMNKGQAVRKAKIVLSSSDEISAMESWWEETGYGRDSFWWVETPKSNPTAYYMKVDKSRLDFPQTIGAETRTLTLDMVEQKPFYSWESGAV